MDANRHQPGSAGSPIGSEGLLRTLFDAITESLCAIDTEGTIVAANIACARRFGLPWEGFVGRNIRHLPTAAIPPQVQAFYWQQVQTSIETRAPVHFEGRRLGRTFQVRLYPVLDPAGEVTQIVISAQDVTEAREQAARLRASELKYRTLVESATEGIGVFDTEGRITFVNPAISRRFGHPAEDFIGRTLDDFLPAAEAAHFAALIRQAQDTGQRQALTSRMTIQGREQWSEVTAVPLADDDSSLSGVMVIARDITDLRRAQAAVESFRREMVHVNRQASVGTLSAMAVHEVSQPLTVAQLSVQNALAALEQDRDPEQAIRELREGLSGLAGIHDILRRFRSFAHRHPQAGVTTLILGDVIDRIAHLAAHNCPETRLTIRTEGLAALPPVRYARQDLEQIAYILIENSLQAADRERDHVLTVTGSVSADTLKLGFADDCGGIAGADTDRLFEPFFTTKSRTLNTGLGLCVAEYLVEEHSGRITVDNRPGEGVTFTVALALDAEPAASPRPGHDRDA